MAKILLATGDAALHAVFEAELEGGGHEVIWAADGQEACALALAESPDLVLLEPNLPVFSGVETCVLLREDPEIPRYLPIMLVTDEEVNPHTVDKARVTEVFPKTHHVSELLDLVVEYAGRQG